MALSAAAKAPPSGLVFGLINFSWPCRAVASCREAFEKVASLAKKCNTPCTLNVSVTLSLSLYFLTRNGRGQQESCTNKLQDKSQ